MRIILAGLCSLVVAVCSLGADLDEQAVTIPEYGAVPKIERYASQEEYEAARVDARFRLTRVTYESDGLEAAA